MPSWLAGRLSSDEFTGWSKRGESPNLMFLLSLVECVAPGRHPQDRRSSALAGLKTDHAHIRRKQPCEARTGVLREFPASPRPMIPPASSARTALGFDVIAATWTAIRPHRQAGWKRVATAAHHRFWPPDGKPSCLVSGAAIRFGPASQAFGLVAQW